jgi:hypothetical protein
MVYRFEMGGFKEEVAGLEVAGLEVASLEVAGLEEDTVDSMDNYIKRVQENKRAIASEIIA